MGQFPRPKCCPDWHHCPSGPSGGMGCTAGSAGPAGEGWPSGWGCATPEESFGTVCLPGSIVVTPSCCGGVRNRSSALPSPGNSPAGAPCWPRPPTDPGPPICACTAPDTPYVKPASRIARTAFFKAEDCFMAFPRVYQTKFAMQQIIHGFVAFSVRFRTEEVRIIV
jgi:hypothetical protein